jgi:hypothetical protein
VMTQRGPSIDQHRKAEFPNPLAEEPVLGEVPALHDADVEEIEPRVLKLVVGVLQPWQRFLNGEENFPRDKHGTRAGLGYSEESVRVRLLTEERVVAVPEFRLFDGVLATDEGIVSAVFHEALDVLGLEVEVAVRKRRDSQRCLRSGIDGPDCSAPG